MNRRTILLLVAIVIAALGAGMIVAYVKGIDARAAEGQELIEVLHASSRIDAGETLAEAQQAGKVEMREVRRVDSVPEALTDTDQQADQAAIATIHPGQQLLRPMFGEGAAAAPSASGLKLQPNQVAVSVSLRDRNRVAGFVTPGSHIAMYLSTEIPSRDGTQKPEAYTTLLLPDVTVLGVGATTKTGKQQEGEVPTEEVVFTLAIDKARAEDVIFGARNAELTFALLGEETQVKVGKGVRLRDVVPNAFGGAR